ncbi:MAG: COP23 domain-containing protein [Chroococcidiopsidaceae cyanobacterium CP_BM_RX_35]|nr:COP23 domain-containing protein [Chroococcidiopsidaceae cyanobacterium CP_BM_RX_35]
MWCTILRVNPPGPWAIPAALGGGWNSEQRCNAISQRLESYRPDGLLELRTAVENNYNTICVTTERNPSCRIVLTVPPGQDPISTRDHVFQNLTLADSGQRTEGVNTLAGGQPTGEVGDLYNLGRTVLGGGHNSVTANSINLQPFLDRADGGTGTRLGNGVPEQTNPRLNPNKFR